MKKLILSAIGFMVLLGGPMETQAQSNSGVKIDFDSRKEQRLWRPVNDGVMGGLSSGGLSFTEDKMVFSGSINTNGGGFSSVRRKFNGKAIATARSITMKVKSDGRDYRVRFRTNVTYRGRRIAFQKTIPVRQAGQWEVVTIELNNMRASLFGRPVYGAQFVPANVVETGIILADGQDGPFRLEVDWIRFD